MTVTTLVIIIIAASAAYTAALVFGITLLLKSSAAYREGVERARRSPAVAALTGAPVREGFFIRGGVRGGGRLARLRVPLSGPRGAGVLEIRAVRTDEGLRFDVLKFHAGGRVHDLSGESAGGREAFSSNEGGRA
ncbi:MAG TPA: cytochrome c oxidase assembly factor Coa1 family protein [Pyrinomonadaceae bacterium]|jgi:hypothetical protein